MNLALPAILYAAASVFLVGMGWRISHWLRAPAPLKIPLTPAPTTSAGVAGRLAGELIVFRSLYKSGHGFWVVAWLFHVSLVLLLAGHFAGLVVPKLAERALDLNESQFEQFAQIAGSGAGILALVTVLWLLIRRLGAERPRAISTFSDYFALILLLLILGTGNHMRFMGSVDIVQARQFVSGWLAFHTVSAPASPVFAAHIVLVSALLVYIPFSKLVHIGGAALFSPTLNQRNNAREHRYDRGAGILPASFNSGSADLPVGAAQKGK